MLTSRLTLGIQKARREADPWLVALSRLALLIYDGILNLLHAFS